MARTIVVGDLHGCRRELADLCDAVALGSSDRLICVGDLVVRGPEPHETLDLLRSLGAVAVRGNHEERVIRAHEALLEGKHFEVGAATKRTLRALTDEDFAHLTSLPDHLTLEEHGLLVVHAGLVPGVPLARQRRVDLLTMRSLDEEGRASAERRESSWAHAYQGEPHVVFGHDAQPEPVLAECATGLDTGCVYGGKLTALVLPLGSAVPALADRRDALVQIPARQVWFPLARGR